MSTVVRTELPVIILHVLVAAADIPVCAHQNRECERSACGCLVPSARALRLQAPGRMHAALPEFRGTGLHGSVRLASRAPAFRCAGDRAGSGSTHEQPLPSKRLFVSFTSPHKTPMRVCCRHSYKVTASRSRSDSKLIKLLYHFLLKMSSRKRLSPSACGRASSRWRSPSAGGRRGLQLYTAAAALYSVLCAFCADRRPTCVFGACLHLRTCALCLRECACAYALLCLFLRVHLRRRGESARSSACVHVYVCMYASACYAWACGRETHAPGVRGLVLAHTSLSPGRPPPFSIPPSLPRLHTTQCLPLCDRFRVRKDREQGRYCSVPAP